MSLDEMLKKDATPRVTKRTRTAEKNHDIVLAARGHFLRDGFAGASMDTIARTANVSVKTIYSHFKNKNDLFSSAMIGACTDDLLVAELPSEQELAQRFFWFSQATRRGLREAGKEYLRHLLAKDQLALYRAVTRDADRFPELGRQYQLSIAHGRTAILVAYLRSVLRKKILTARDAVRDAEAYEGLLRAGIFEAALHGLLTISADKIEQRAASASATMWVLLSGTSRK